MTAEFWQEVIVEGIKAGAAIMVAVLGLGWPVLRRLRHVRDDAAAGRQAAEQAREQVQNDHATNLRDDVDALARTAAANTQAIGAVALEVKKMSETMARIEGRGRRRRRWL